MTILQSCITTIQGYYDQSSSHRESKVVNYIQRVLYKMSRQTELRIKCRAGALV